MPVQYTCQHCGVVFSVSPSVKRRFCSDSCYRASGTHRQPHASIADRFWHRVDKTRQDGCWLWTGARGREGYGSIGIQDHKTERAHRIAWQLTHGTIPGGLCVLHHCDTPACVRPSHLFLGTRTENNADKMAKGRNVAVGLPGESNPQARLTANQVREIRERYASGNAMQLALANEYGVSRPLISMIVTGKIWRSLIS